MMRYSRSIVAALLVLNNWPSLSAEGGALNYPEKPIRLISAYAPGGGNDMMARAGRRQAG